ncbi:NADH-ubiquinone oxidoreductase chain [Trifolium pratense]|uniref:NADH-ubiquinone oxidoreductase chain n=1 Tax=Trifolium pratense TaxID=57577 RepID=A0A2K3PF24_TRIPR|nr:NADH-ubiquinone oxidoreductase chain [Trifolium pratense]
MRAKLPPMAEMFSRLPPPLWGSGPLTIWSTDHTEGQALKRRTGTSGINVFQFLALHRPSNGPWTKRPLPERTMSRGPPPPHKGMLAMPFLSLPGRLITSSGVDGSTSYNHEAEVIVLEGLLPRMKLDSGRDC